MKNYPATTVKLHKTVFQPQFIAKRNHMVVKLYEGLDGGGGGGGGGAGSGNFTFH